MKITVLSRPGCHLCDEAISGLKEFLAARGGGDGKDRVETGIEIVNIEDDDELHRRYLELIPVLLLDGEIISELSFDPEEIDAALARRSRARA